MRFRCCRCCCCFLLGTDSRTRFLLDARGANRLTLRRLSKVALCKSASLALNPEEWCCKWLLSSDARLYSVLELLLCPSRPLIPYRVTFTFVRPISFFFKFNHLSRVKLLLFDRKFEGTFWQWNCFKSSRYEEGQAKVIHASKYVKLVC